MLLRLHKGDLPESYNPGPEVAVDTETMGLKQGRDRLCLVQLSTGDGSADLVQIDAGQDSAPKLESVLGDASVLKLFHFGRFDIAVLKRSFGCAVNSVYCTRIASRFARTYTDQHGLKVLCREILGLDINKEQQSSDWGADKLSEEQLNYAAVDVIHLHALKRSLDEILEREGRAHLALECFAFLPVRADIDNAGWENKDIFAH